MDTCKLIEHNSTEQEWWNYHTSKLYGKCTTWQMAEQKYQIIKWQNGKGTAQYMIENTHTRKWQKIHIGKMQEQICTILKLVENAAI